MRRIVWLFIGATLLTGCFGSRYHLSDADETVYLSRSVDVQKMRSAIISGGERRDWMVQKEEPGCITLELSVRGGKHKVVVAVNYDDKSFAVRYVSSVNMEYDPQTRAIHKKYVQWVRNLKQDIRIAAGKMSL